MAVTNQLGKNMISYSRASQNRHRLSGSKQWRFYSSRDVRSIVKKITERRSKDYPIKAMIHVAEEVLRSRNVIVNGVSSLLEAFPIVACKFCPEVYIGEEGHLIKSCHGFQRQSRNQLHRWAVGGLTDVLVPVESFHLQHISQGVIRHDQRFDSERIPAIVELCLQAGIDLDHDIYPDITGTDRTDPNPVQDTKSMSETTLAAWETLRHGVQRLLLAYPAKVCKYCSEVHIGPSGHLARNCGLFKFQRWRGKHFWKKAEVNDIVPRKIVWRRRPQDPPVLVDEMRDFYGHAPAVVELCSKAGAIVPPKYHCMMKIQGLSRRLHS